MHFPGINPYSLHEQYIKRTFAPKPYRHEIQHKKALIIFFIIISHTVRKANTGNAKIIKILRLAE